MTTVEPLRVAFRRQVREQALEVAHQLVVEKGWDLVRVGEIATLTGVSRPTVYKEFGNKQGLGEALVRRETDRFLSGIGRVLDEHTTDAEAAIAAAVRWTLDEATDNPLLHAVLTATRGGDEALLPLLTTRSAPLLEAASAALSGWFRQHFPELPERDVTEGVDAIVRLTVSHLVLPVGHPEQTAAQLARIAIRYLRAAGS